LHNKKNRNYLVLLIAAVIFLVFFSSKETNHEEIRQTNNQNNVAEQNSNTSSETGTRKLSSSSEATKVAIKNIEKNELLVALNRDSTEAWELRIDDDAQKIIGGLLPNSDKDILSASQDFLAKYSTKLFGIDPRSLILQQVNDKGDPQIITYKQTLQGIPVYQSRVVLFYDQDMNLIYASSSGGATSQGHNVSPKIDANQAAQSAVIALQKNNSGSGGVDKISVSQLASSAEYFVYKSGNMLSNVYRFVVTLSAPTYGDHEIIVDAENGRIVLLRTISRK